MKLKLGISENVRKLIDCFRSGHQHDRDGLDRVDESDEDVDDSNDDDEADSDDESYELEDESQEDTQIEVTERFT